MCIRDSINGAKERMRPVLMTATVAAVGMLPAAINHGLGSCLLYTSDAADERSSVDLGGRRIIKKKN